MTMKSRRSIAAGMMALLLSAAPLPARTIAVTAEDCDEMAVISARAPRLSWAMPSNGGEGMFHVQPTLYWDSKTAVLMRFPIAALIPKGQRVTRAELTITASYVESPQSEVHVRRVLAEWGSGVCHQYRMVHPQKLEWSQPGCRGAATDRANKDSAVFKTAKIGDYTADLTEDIELWYTGAVPNRGWIFTLEPDASRIYVPAPYCPAVAAGKQWKLQITFEPR